MKRPSRERERPADARYADDLEPRGVVRPAPHPAVQPPHSWARRNWISIVGISVGLLVSIWRFGIPQFPRPDARSPRGFFPPAEFHRSVTVAAGNQIEIKGMNGAVRAVATDGDQVEITAIRRSRGMNPADVPIAVVEEGGDVTVCAALPEAPSQCAEGGDGDFGGAGVSVDYTVRVPEGVVFAATTVNGGISVEGLTADVEVETVNGGVEISTTGSARAETVNGSIRASVGETTADLRFETVNGSIAVDIPDHASVDVRAETLSGGISSDFPLDIPRTKPGESKTATGRIGSGEHDLSMETVNGSIELRKASRRGPTPPTPPRPPRPVRGDRGQS